MTDRRSEVNEQAEVRGLLEAARFDEALKRITSALERAPEHPSAQRDWHYLAAVALRYLERFDEALEAIGQALAADPKHGRSFQELGHTLQLCGRLPEAEQAYEQALQHNPALLASWRGLLALLKLHHLQPRLKQQIAQAEQALKARESQPPALLAAESLMHEGSLERADSVCRTFLQTQKTHPEGLRLLAAINERAGHLADAEFLLETLLELEPASEGPRYDYANLLLRMQKFEPARAETRRLLASRPGHLPYLSLHANALAGVGEASEAIRLYDQVLERSPAQPQLLVMRGHAEKTEGRAAAAVKSYQRAYGLRPDYGDAYWSLANTKAYAFSDAEIEAMEAAFAAEQTTTEDRIHLAFALGKAFEDRDEHEGSFAYYDRGNALKRAAVAHRPEYLAQRADKQQRFFRAELFEALAGSGCPDPAPIFIVGLPRAGSTLLEQILASHSQIDGTMELPNIISLVQRLRRGARRGQLAAGYPEVLETLEPAMFRRFGEQFLEQTRVYRGSGAFFIDKNPNNFFHVGLLRLILPNAKVIDARRHPLSCCFSGFKQLFGQGQEFSYGLHEIGNYYREYVSLMDHWDEVLPGFVHRVQHETLVDNFEEEVRGLLDFCGVPFEPACLEFYKTERSVRTPSSEQVRQPLFRSALEAWRPFSPWLDPLRDALGSAVRERYGVAASHAETDSVDV